MNRSTPLENQLLVTKFYIPIPSGPLISRPHLMSLLDESLEYPLTLVSAAAGFGKTTLLASWSQALPAGNPRVAWVSLSEEDNDPRLFWAYVLTALNKQGLGCFTPLLEQLQSLQSPPLKPLLTELINRLMEGPDCLLLILDDYQMIADLHVHTTLAYVIEHLPPQLRIIVATRSDPPLPLPLLRARKHVLEVRTDQLRCTVQETEAFFKEVMRIELSGEMIEHVFTRTEGWLVGMRLLGLSWDEQTDPLVLLQDISGDHRYILDYLAEEVLRRRPQQIQTFLLSTCILEQLSASLCDATVGESASQHILQQLERTNLFVTSLDSKRQWYRYHALFAQALRYQLEQTRPDLVPILHHRASLWYAEHHQTTQAMRHALRAQAWPWAADLIERECLPFLPFAWEGVEEDLTRLKEWLERLPAEVMGSHPQLCLVCAQILWQVAPPQKLRAWLDIAEEAVAARLLSPTPQQVGDAVLVPDVQRNQENLLGEVVGWRAYLCSIEEDREALTLCQQALALLSADNMMSRTLIALAQSKAYALSSTNDAVSTIESEWQAISLAQATGQAAVVCHMKAVSALHLMIVGQLHQAEHLAQQAIGQVGTLLLGCPTVILADIMREWDELDTALALAEGAISRSEQIKSVVSLIHWYYGYQILLRVSLSRSELEAAYAAFQEAERIGMLLNKPASRHLSSFSYMSDRVRLWLACGQRDRAIHWAEQRELSEREQTPFTWERAEVAHARVLLAVDQSDLALQRLEPVLQRATQGQRWSHVIEIRLLQARAYQMGQQKRQALDTLWKAVQLGEPEGYIRSFVDEGISMQTLLSGLRKRESEHGPTPYLDRLLAAFEQKSTTPVQAGMPIKVLPPSEILSGREQQVLQLLARGASNLEIAQQLVIALDTVKRHVSHIFSKLGVYNRVQAARKAGELGLLGEED